MLSRSVPLPEPTPASIPPVTAEPDCPILADGSRYVPLMMASSMSWRFFSSSSPSACRSNEHSRVTRDMIRSEATYGRNEQLLDLVDGPLELHFGPVLRVLDRDEHVQLVVQVLPVGLAAVLLLLRTVRGKPLINWQRVNSNAGYLLLVPHRAPPTDHDLAAGLLLQLFGSHAARAEDPAHKVELQRATGKRHAVTSS